LSPLWSRSSPSGASATPCSSLGRNAAVLWIGVAFGLAHGLLEALPILIAFGAGLALIRARTDSVYPGMVVHGLFNAVALIVSVST